MSNPPDQLAAPPKKSHKAPNTRVGHNNKPPLRSKRSVKNSHTSPRRIALARKTNEALNLRAGGLAFREIARRQHTSTAVAHGRVTRALHALPVENAREVLGLELQRLDGYLRRYHADAIAGDQHAAELALKIVALRAKLLGLTPEIGTLLMTTQSGQEQPTIAVEFILPSGTPGGQRISRLDMIEHNPVPTPEPTPPPPPPPGFGAIELDSDGTGMPMYQDASGTYQAREYHDRFQDVNGRWRRGRTE